MKMLLAHLRLEFRIVQQQISKLRPLLHEVDLGHALGPALEIFGGMPTSSDST